MNQPPSEAQVFAAVDLWNSTVGERLLRILTPIYREGYRHPELLGSGVLLDCSEFVCLVTAAHVAEDVRDGTPHYFGAAEQLLPLGGMRYTSPLPAGTSRNNDRLDLAWWVLKRDTAAMIPANDLLPIGDLHVAGADTDAGGFYLVNGYPATRQPRRFSRDEWKVVPFGFVTEEASAAEYAAAEIDTKQNLFVHFDVSDTYRRGLKITGPNLHGVSGGAVWQLRGAAASLDNPKLAAIVISWRQASPKGIIGVRSAALVRGLVQNFEHMRQHVRGS